jgi:hypothetical protein
MFKKIAIGLALVLAVILGLAAMQPDDFKVSRSASISAAPSKVYPLISDFRKWQQWSPWEKMDPDMKRSFEGKASGEGAVYAWEGNSAVGSGKMTIEKAKAPSQVGIKLEFFKPMQGVNPTEFLIEPEGKGSKVVWTMSGKHNFISKIMCVFFNMDKMIGPDFEKGLSQMKAAAEAAK